MSEIKIGLIGGTGLGDALGANAAGARHEVETPFGKPSDAILEANWGGLTVFTLSRHGPGHVINPSQINYRANIFALKQLGVTHILASGAVGSLREEIRPQDLVIPGQVIDRTFKRAATFYEQAAVHVEFAEPFCPVLRQILIETSEGSRFRVQGSEKASSLNPEPRTQNPILHDRGCYICMEGPAFSTQAESLMHRLWGGDLIGMTVMPEAKLAKEAEISYALIALVTDYDCWRNKPNAPKADAMSLLAEIKGNLQAASANAIGLMRAAVERIASNPELVANVPAAKALELAIWSDKAKISPDEIQKLAPLWGKYFT